MDSPYRRHTVTGWPDTGGPAHADRPALPSARLVVGAAVGGAVVLTAVGFGAAACLDSLGPARSAPTSAQRITVSTEPAATDTALPGP